MSPLSGKLLGFAFLASLVFALLRKRRDNNDIVIPVYGPIPVVPIPPQPPGDTFSFQIPAPSPLIELSGEGAEDTSVAAAPIVSEVNFAYVREVGKGPDKKFCVNYNQRARFRHYSVSEANGVFTVNVDVDRTRLPRPKTLFALVITLTDGTNDYLGIGVVTLTRP